MTVPIRGAIAVATTATVTTTAAVATTAAAAVAAAATAAATATAAVAATAAAAATAATFTPASLCQGLAGHHDGCGADRHRGGNHGGCHKRGYDAAGVTGHLPLLAKS
ncbi:hypothetical protein GCM10017056_37860 [Seohaeicola zhoushanensis]|uniref:Secreted protein n=1 Tax=Seohaeicola zhoushanensis TaxID=1569283 RepID=A0A8J3M9Q5_9RHOB|nr:hypothetical protein GCM10017056_37860 [Seohaeicola zhoushanensis]